MIKSIIFVGLRQSFLAERGTVKLMLEVSTKGRYATRILIALSVLARNGRPSQKKQIAEREDISVDYVEQLLMRLRRAGLVTSFRGAGGGFALARRPEEITVADVIEATEGPIVIAPRVKGEPARGSSGVTQVVWQKASENLRRLFASYTIRDLADEAERLRDSRGLSFEI
jgi:Rrf2 family protein